MARRKHSKSLKEIRSSEEMILLRLAEYEKVYKRFLTKIKKLANEMDTYSIRVPNLKMLASMLGMAYNTEFLEATRMFNKSQCGDIKKPLGEDYWIEVIPF